jgi:broad specificity phosphatase PhoE
VAELVLIRHGETAWSRIGQHTGITDIPLTDCGTDQARRIGQDLDDRRFAAVWCSPRQRARDTARLAGLRQARVEPALAEWDYGAYDGQTTADISAQLGRPWSLWTDGVRPGATPGETVEQVAARADTVLIRARPILDAGDDVALVAHGHILRVLAAIWLDLPPESGALFALSAGSISSLGFEHHRPALTGWNHIPHPPDDLL